MIKHHSAKGLILISIILTGLSSSFHLSAQATRDVNLTVHLRGVYESKISLLAISKSQIFEPIIEVPEVLNGGTTTLLVTKDHLPGEFVLRFDYKENAASTPYPSEKYLFINDQDLEFQASPVYCNNADSSYFQADERENKAFAKFSAENGKQKEKLGVLQNFLLSYDDTGSKFYQEGISEYEKRREAYNQWLAGRTAEDKALFVSSLYSFQYVVRIPWEGNETDRVYSLINHYFDGIQIREV